MKLNLEKTKVMLFNTSNTKDFEPLFEVENTEIQVVTHTKLLGFHLTNNLNWKKHIDEMTKKAYTRIWILKRLVRLGASQNTLVDTYIKQIRSILEYGVAVWHSSITLEQRLQIERVQATCMRVILGHEYQSAGSARQKLKLDKLENRRSSICQKFGLKASTHPNHSKWFKVNQKPNQNLRTKQTKYKIALR